MSPNKSKEHDMITVPGDKNDSKHRVSVTISDPNHTMASMRREKVEKRIRLHANDSEHAVALAKAHYKRQGYKVHDAQHIGMTEEKEMNEAVTVKKTNYSWGKMVTVHHGADTSYPLHPEHQAAIKKLKPGESTSFTDETNRKVTASREGDQVHLSGRGTNKKTTVAHSHFTEGNMSLFKQFRAQLEEKTLTPAEKKKREEVAKAIERENPNMPMGMKMAIATKTAKRVAEEEEFKNLDEAVKTTHEDPLVTVHDKDGLHTHAYLSTANRIFNTNVKHTDVHKGPVTVNSGHEDKRKLKFAISMHHAAALKESEEAEDEGVHYCAKHVRSSLLGDGIVLEAQHADPDDQGNIEWYMVEFKSGIRKVYTEDLEIMIAEYHGNHKKKRMTNG